MTRIALSAALLASVLTACLPLTALSAADFTARQVTEELYRANSGAPPDYTKRDLAGLDLAGLHFKSARMTEANLFGADLTGADLTGVDLRSAKLDRIIAIGTRFDRANLAGASLLRPTTSTSFEATGGETPSFNGLGDQTFNRALSLQHWLQASNPMERWKWNTMFQDLPPVKGHNVQMEQMSQPTVIPLRLVTEEISRASE